MNKRYLNPPGSPQPKSYHHAVVAAGGRLVFLSGQVAFDGDRQIVGRDDVVVQTRQAMHNLQAAVEAAGGQMSDIVQITTHVVDYDPAQLDAITTTIAGYFPAESLPANTLVEVVSLSTPGLLVEIGGIAVLAADEPGTAGQ